MKKIIVVFIILMMMLALGACGEKTYEENNTVKTYKSLAFLVPEDWSGDSIKTVKRNGISFDGVVYSDLYKDDEVIAIYRYKFDKSKYAKASEQFDYGISAFNGKTRKTKEFKKIKFVLKSKGHKKVNGKKYRSATFEIKGIRFDGEKVNGTMKMAFIPNEYTLYVVGFGGVGYDDYMELLETDQQFFFDNITFDFD